MLWQSTQCDYIDWGQSVDLAQNQRPYRQRLAGLDVDVQSRFIFFLKALRAKRQQFQWEAVVAQVHQQPVARAAHGRLGAPGLRALRVVECAAHNNVYDSAVEAHASSCQGNKRILSYSPPCSGDSSTSRACGSSACPASGSLSVCTATIRGPCRLLNSPLLNFDGGLNNNAALRRMQGLPNVRTM